MDEPATVRAATTRGGARSTQTPHGVPTYPEERNGAFSEFYRDFVPTLVAFLRWQGVPLRDAADIAQETMIRMYPRWNTIRHPKAWARRVAGRMWARRTAKVMEEPVAELPEQPSLLASTDMTEWEQRHDILRALDQLPSRQRQVLAWAIDGYTPKQIAVELRLTPEAVRGSLVKARRSLAEYLCAQGELP